MACPAGVSTTPRPAGASTGTPTWRSSLLICCDTAEAVNPSSSAARASVPRAATDRNACKAPTSIMKAGYAILARKHRWTALIGAGQDRTMTDPHHAADLLFGSNLVAAVAGQAKNQARVLAGIGTYDTAASIRRARDAEASGADALLLVCPYYSKPTQAGVVAHCVAVADATELPVMLYDVPARAGIAMEAPTLVE